MPATMNKADVKISVKNPRNANWPQTWAQVQQCSGKAVPAVAKQVVKEAVDNPKLKKLSVKVGLIKRDLYLRLKNGDDHLQDIKLVPNWTAPQGWVDGNVDVDDEDDGGGGGGAPVVDPQHAQDLLAWKRGKEDCKALGERTVTTMQRLLDNAENAVERAEVEAEIALSGKDIRGTSLANARQAMQQVRDLAQQAETAYQQYFRDFDRHRTGEKGDQFSQDEKEGYGVAFFMQVLKPLFQNATDLQSALAVAESAAQTAVTQIQALAEGGAEAAQLVKVSSLNARVKDLMEKSRVVLGGMTGDISSMVAKGSGLGRDLTEVLAEKNQELKLHKASNALSRITLVRDAAPRMERFLSQAKGMAGEAAKVPKELRTGAIKEQLDEFTLVFKELVTYHAQWHKHAETAEKLYKEVLKQVGK